MSAQGRWRNLAALRGRVSFLPFLGAHQTEFLRYAPSCTGSTGCKRPEASFLSNCPSDPWEGLISSWEGRIVRSFARNDEERAINNAYSPPKRWQIWVSKRRQG
jgi:hypothetical protein